MYSLNFLIFCISTYLTVTTWHCSNNKIFEQSCHLTSRTGVVHSFMFLALFRSSHTMLRTETHWRFEKQDVTPDCRQVASTSDANHDGALLSPCVILYRDPLSMVCCVYTHPYTTLPKAGTRQTAVWNFFEHDLRPCRNLFVPVWCFLSCVNVLALLSWNDVMMRKLFCVTDQLAGCLFCERVWVLQAMSKKSMIEKWILIFCTRIQSFEWIFMCCEHVRLIYFKHVRLMSWKFDFG